MRAFFALGGISTAILVVIVGMYISYSNKEIVIRNQAEAVQKESEVIFDKVWKVIQQQANVTDKYKDSFKEIYVEVMDARYKEGGNLMKWIQEANPNFDSSLYKQLMNTISAERADFANVQTKLISVKQEHDNLRLQFPGSLFLSGRRPLEIHIVTSTKTDAAFSTGKEDDIKL